MRFDQNTRLAVIATLVQAQGGRPLGRTALMKLCYFLQVVRGVPLGYRFTLYSYGPFDSEVLTDLQTAESMGVLASQLVTYSGGFGYEIRTGRQARRAGMVAGDVLERYGADIRWIAELFQGKSASELELLSTVVFVDREAGRAGRQLTLAEVAVKVKDVKPHFTAEQIDEAVTWMRDEGFLMHLSQPVALTA